MTVGPVPLSTAHLTLEPLTVEHADELVAVLSDRRLYEFTGGSPPTVDELRTRYARQVVGHSADGTQVWLNWVLRHRETGAAVGTIQATVFPVGSGLVAEVAWMVGVEHQRQGFAREAAAAMITWLRCPMVAHIHPAHAGSMAVARALGLHPTDELVDGEVRWESRT